MAKVNASNQAEGLRARRRARLPFFCEGQTRAKQSFKDECDINGIMAKFERTGVIEHVKQHGAKYGDFLAAPQDYHDACNQVLLAQQTFLNLPAKVRKEFANDPGELLAAIDAANNGDADQLDRLTRLGLLQTTAQPGPAGPRPGAAGEPDKAPKAPEASAPKAASDGS